MKKTGKSLICILAGLALAVSLISVLAVVSFAAEPNVGMDFDDKSYFYEMTNVVKPQGSITIEAEVWIAYNTKDNTRSGVILGNYSDDYDRYGDNKGSYGLELYNNGNVRFYTRNSGNYVFTGYDIRKDMGTADAPKFAKIAVVADTVNNRVTLYVNGEQKATMTDSRIKAGAFSAFSNSLCLGGDRRIGNGQNFKGEIKNVTMYSDVRTAAEIKASADAATYSVDTTDPALLAAYNLTSAKPLVDLSANANDLRFTTLYGKAFTADQQLFLNKTLEQAPLTYEAVIYAPTSTPSNGRSGVIIGNWTNATKQQPCLNFEIHSGGNPQLSLCNKVGDPLAALKFDQVDVRREEWVHLVIVQDTDELRCYINGELAQTLDETFTSDIAAMQSVNRLTVGGDARPDNTMYFKGLIRDVALYSEVLTDAQIKSSYEDGIDTNNDSIILHYEMNDPAGTSGSIKDLSGNGYHASSDYYERDEQKDYAFSFAVVGDTQKQVWADYKSRLDSDSSNDTNYTANIYKWIIDNKDKKNIQWVFGVGDITENNGVAKDDPNKTSSALEWELAKAAITTLDQNGVNYSVVMGNHDTVAQLDKYFADPKDDFYTSKVSGYYQKCSLGNYYINFEVAGIKYMVLGLEYGANDKILRWASEVVEAHPERRVIVTTHAYMFRDNTTLDKNDVVPPNSSGVTTGDTSKNNGDMMWDKFVSQHRNIFMVLSGHDPYSNIAFRQDKGVNGNVVSQFLVDPQGMAVDLGMVCMLYFSEDGKDVSVEWISTGKTQKAQAEDPTADDILYKAMNQFDFKAYDNVGNGVCFTELVEEESNLEKSVYRIYYTNGTYDEFVINHGKDGAPGASGESGSPGENGKSPYIGENGNWFLDGIDTGVRAQGQDAPAGEMSGGSGVLILGIATGICGFGCIALGALCIILAKKKKIF